jgi:vacuolar-type H+-ATPase subunit C/Vma6
MSALVLAGGDADLPGKRAFVEGGRRLSLEAFLHALAAGDAGAAGTRLAAAFRPTALAAVFERVSSAATIEDELLRARIGLLHDAERQDPAGLASVLEFALRVRAEVIDVRRVIWGVALGAPRAALVAG